MSEKVTLPINTDSKTVEKELTRMLACGGEYTRLTKTGFVCQTKGLMSKMENGQLFVYSTDKKMWVMI